jgi:3-oxoacyl-[acyl-carrier-protein] synthase-3
MFAAFRSIDAYIPSNICTNDDLSKRVDTSDEWIQKRTGIKTRYFASDDENTSDLGYKASIGAIKRANLEAKDIDLVLCATISPDYFCMPSTACLIAQKLGIANVASFDISAACSGFIYALAVAKAFIESGMSKNVLIIGAEKLSSIVDFEDRTTCVLFGDGAGAAVISATANKDEAIKDIHISADGNYHDFLMTPACGTNQPCSEEVLKERTHFIKMRGNETFKLAVKTLSNDVKEILANNNMSNDDIDHFIPHQANYRIIKAVGDLLGFGQEQVVLTVGKYGNTSSASIPMAINEMYESGKLQSGQMMLLDAFGGGLTWGSALVPFSMR